MKTIDPSDYDYKNGLQQLQKTESKLGEKSTSVYSRLGTSTEDMYNTQTYKQYHGTEEPAPTPVPE